MDKNDLLAVIRVLKKRFNSLTAEELILLASEILDSIKPDNHEEFRYKEIATR